MGWNDLSTRSLRHTREARAIRSLRRSAAEPQWRRSGRESRARAAKRRRSRPPIRSRARSALQPRSAAADQEPAAQRLHFSRCSSPAISSPAAVHRSTLVSPPGCPERSPGTIPLGGVAQHLISRHGIPAPRQWARDTCSLDRVPPGWHSPCAGDSLPGGEFTLGPSRPAGRSGSRRAAQKAIIDCSAQIWHI
jgi:hypothetical protein